MYATNILFYVLVAIQYSMHTIRVVYDFNEDDFKQHAAFVACIRWLRYIILCIPASLLVVSICILRGKIKKLNSPTISSKDALMHVHTAIFGFYIAVAVVSYALENRA